jgi:cyclic pyranopterin phosphate synthase
MSQPLVDQFQRRISYLRLSVIDRCDCDAPIACPSGRLSAQIRGAELEELHKLALGFIGRGVTKIRLTGEPLVRRDMIELVRAIGRKIGDGLEELTITTNGTRLAEFADDLREAGICRVNVSLDTLDRENLPGSPGAINCRRCLKASRRRARRACRSSSTPSR